MKLIDKYIYAIGQKLPLKSRNEIKVELKSLLLDEIEEKYGENPSELEVTEAIREFGTPYTVAKRYQEERPVIENGLTDIYFLIMKIIIGAMAVSFTVVFIVSLFTNNVNGLDILKEFVKIPLNVFKASLSGIGTLTVVFIILSRFLKDKNINLDEDWDIKELNSISLTEDGESKVESIIAIILIPIFIVIINIYPNFIVYLENLFEKGPFTLGNRVNMEIFRGYIVVFSILGALQVIYQVLLLKTEVKSKALYLYNISISLFDVIVAVTILKTGTLFIYTVENRGIFTTSTIGIKLFIILGLITSFSELISKLVKYIKKEIISNNFPQ